MLKKSIADDLMSAMKNKQVRTVSILRLLNSEIKNLEIDLKRELNEDELIAAIRKEIKKLKDALELFKKGNRSDLVSENEEQIAILLKYVPPELSDEELKKSIHKIISENKETYEKNPKSIIGVCMKSLSSSASPQRIMNILSSVK
jgi:hypothetical protein